MVQLRYRPHAAIGRRLSRGTLRYTEAEWAVIVAAAVVSGMRPTAWVQHVAYETARSHRSPDRDCTEALLAELRQQRRVLTNIGGNLNDLAKAANATGELTSLIALQSVLRLVRSVVLSTDEVIRRVHRELAG